MKKQLLFISLIILGSSLYAAERAKPGKLTKAVARLALEDDISSDVVALCSACDRGISVAQTATAQILPCHHMYHFNCAETAKALGCFACSTVKKDKHEVKGPAAPAKKVVAPKKEAAKREAAPKKEVAKEPCSICLSDKIEKPKALPCGHVFCTKCIDEALSTVADRSGQLKNECPVCRKPVREGAQPVRIAQQRAGEVSPEDMAAILAALEQAGGQVVVGGAGAGYVQRNCALCEGHIERGQEQQRAGQWYHAGCRALLS